MSEVLRVIERLDRRKRGAYGMGDADAGLAAEALNTIEQLQLERDDLDERLNERYSRCNSLEADNKRLLDELKSLQEGWDLIKQLNEIVQKENTRYREALEIMADRNRFWREVEFQTGSDRRQYAQQVLVELDKAEALKDE